MICTTESDQSLELSNAKGSELFLIALVLNRYDIARSPTCCEAFHSVCLVAMTTLCLDILVVVGVYCAGAMLFINRSFSFTCPKANNR